MTHALLVIDMQQGSFGEATPWHDVAGLVGRLNRLAGTVRETGGAVVFIQHDGPPGDPHHPDLPGWKLLDELEVRLADTIIRKKSCDASNRSGGKSSSPRKRESTASTWTSLTSTQLSEGSGCDQ